MTPRRLAQKIFREWCKANGIAMEPICAADLVDQIADALARARIKEAGNGR